jgi:hypothetical protein
MTGMLVILLGLVAFSSRSGFSSSSQPAVSNTYISYAMSVFLIVFVAMIPLAIYNYFIRTKDSGIEARAPNKRLVRMVLGLVFLGLLIYLRHYFLKHGGIFGHSGLFHHQKLAPNDKGNGAHGTTPRQPHFEYIVLWISLAVGSVAAVAAFIAYKRRPPLPVKVPLTFQEQVAATIDDAIDDLEREPDPRRAVIAAYARMERTLGRHGLERRLSETAIEYMRRALLEFTARSDAVERLTSLFEQAKFSKHEITADMKQDAIASLREIRESIP